MALLAGRKSLASNQRYGRLLTPKQQATVGWPSNRVGTFRPAPIYTAHYNLLCKMDTPRLCRRTLVVRSPLIHISVILPVLPSTFSPCCQQASCQRASESWSGIARNTISENSCYVFTFKNNLV